ncbi:hypothetical protein ACFL3G_13325, partial [Planctomycetota bacterium]
MCKKLIYLTIVLLLAASTNAAWIDDSDVTATASSNSAEMEPNYTCDLSGLTGDLHDTTYSNMWMSTSGGGGSGNPNPGTVTGASWIKFAFDQDYNLGRAWVWNNNETDAAVGRGLRNVTVEYATTDSSDPNDWTTLGEFEFVKGDAADDMRHGDELDFDGATAQYVVITAKNTNGNHGDNWFYSLSEVRFAIAAPEIVMAAPDLLPEISKAIRLEVDSFYLPDDANDVTFYRTDPNGSSFSIGTHNQTPPVYVDWTPGITGEHKLFAQVGDVNSDEVTVFVPNQFTHFNFWGSDRDAKWVSSYFLIDSPSNSLYRLRRGTFPLAYMYGQAWSGPQDEPNYVAYWESDTLYPDRSKGIMIDEFGGGGALDDLMGRALSTVRANDANIFIAAYSVSVPTSPSDQADGLADANVAMIESYAVDWRFYANKFSRYEDAVTAGLEDNALPCIAWGDTYASTVKEMEQQFNYIRENYPNAPGIAFYGSASEAQRNAIDDMIYDYFLGPACRFVDGGSTTTVYNEGS